MNKGPVPFSLYEGDAGRCTLLKQKEYEEKLAGTDARMQERFKSAMRFMKRDEAHEAERKR